MTFIEVAAGLVVVALIGLDIFTAVVVPRPAQRGMYRLSRAMVRLTWPVWREIGLRIRSSDAREAFLGIFAPAIMIVNIALWVGGFIVGYGLILYAIGSQVKPPLPDLGTAVYFSGTSLLTIGFGDYVPAGFASRATALAAAASGLATFAITVSFLFLLFVAFQRRENFVIVLDASAGAPPSGVEILETHARNEIRHDLSRLFGQGQSWAADILETHLAYPLLNFFRSSHRDESWLGALGALLDAATLQITTVAGISSNVGQAKLMIEVGTHLVEDMCRYFEIEFERDVIVEPPEYDAARTRLEAAGYTLRDRDAAWQAFRELRGQYARPLNAMAKYWAIPPAYWIGDRSSVRH